MIMGLKTAELKGLEVWTNTIGRFQQDNCEDTFFMASKKYVKIITQKLFSYLGNINWNKWCTKAL